MNWNSVGTESDKKELNLINFIFNSESAHADIKCCFHTTILKQYLQIYNVAIKSSFATTSVEILATCIQQYTTQP